MNLQVNLTPFRNIQNKNEFAQSCPTLCVPMDYSPTRLLRPWDFSRQESWSGLPFPSPGDLPNPGIKPPSPALQADDLPSEPPGKTLLKIKVKVAQSCLSLCDPMDYAIHGILQARILECLFLLQGIFPSQGSNPGLLHSRQILYQLSHKGSPKYKA